MKWKELIERIANDLIEIDRQDAFGADRFYGIAETAIRAIEASGAKIVWPDDLTEEMIHDAVYCVVDESDIAPQVFQKQWNAALRAAPSLTEGNGGREMSKITVIFYREEVFYPIELLAPSKCGKSLEEQAAEHAKLNPGTIRVETLKGKVLWRL